MRGARARLTPSVRAPVTVTCAGVERLLGRHTQARARLEAALRRAARIRDSPEAVALMLELASDSLLRGEYDAIAAGRHAPPQGAARLDDPVLTTAALAMQALAAAMAARCPRPRGSATKRRERIDDLTDEDVARSLDSLVHLATAEMYTDRFEASGRHAERALAVGRATGQGELFPLIFPMLGTALWVQGRVAEAARIFDDAVDAARMLDNFQGLAWQLFNRSFAASMAGDVELALATATRERGDSRRVWTTASSPPTPRGRSPWPLLETGRRRRPRICCSHRPVGPELRLDPRRLAGLRSRAADPLLPGGRPARGGRGEPRRRRQRARRPSACRWRPRSQLAPRQRSRSQAAIRRARSRAGTRLRGWLSRMPAASSTRPSRARSPDARWRRRASASSPRPSSSAAAVAFRRSAARATRPQPSMSCASSGAASTTAHGRARQTRSAWSR